MKGDTISRQAAIDAIDHICPVDTEYDCTLLDRVDVRYVLSDLPSAQQWIPCSERLPAEGKEVLISTNGSIYTSAYDMFEGGPYWYDTVEYITIREVDAWMPLPEPYNKEAFR